ncbi:MAG: HNH endonuclease [Gammaproteobacteria bacterium]|nr:HNH endonuclease [Gammaproteobacteria bacterium]
MRRLTTPDDDPLDVFRACISRVKDVALKTRLISVERNVVAEANTYRVAAAASGLYALPPQADVGGVVSRDEMTDVYKLRMAKKGAPGRPFYDKLMAAPAHGRCPLCGQRTVSTLDHYLPKAHYPALAVVPVNLVPACSDCNKAKNDDIPNEESDQTLHPYFDDIEGDVWLVAEVVEDSPAALRFVVDPPVGWDGMMVARVLHHFKVFKLSILYASHAAEEIVNIRASLEMIYGRSGAGAVRAHLLEQAGSREAVHANSWQTATYKAMAVSNWFCEGGFRS